MTDEEFEQIVKQALDELPDEFQTQLENVEVVIEDWGRNKKGKPDMHLLGLYHGVPRIDRQGPPLLPDKISIYREAILRISQDSEVAKKHIKDTVRHEIGHYFGMTDEELKRIEYH